MKLIRHFNGEELAVYIGAHRSNNDIYSRLAYLHPAELRKEDHFTILSGTKIVAVASTQPNLYQPHILWLKQVSVDAEHRKRGYATQLVNAVFADTASRKLALQPSSFTPLGAAYLKAVMPRLHCHYPDLAIYWNEQSRVPVSGAKPYQLDLTRQRSVQFL